MRTLTFHEDPGHGWLEVPFIELVYLGVAGKISTCSYMHHGKAYLEEDNDAGIYLDALNALNIEYEFNTIHKDNTPIRNYPYYRTIDASDYRE